jgi:hypothetical protein
MNNTLIDVSINTMIGNLPWIMNYNNDIVEKEFSDLFMYVDGYAPILKVDVSNNTVNCHTGYFRNVNIGGKVLDSAFVDKYVRIDASVQSLENRVTALESSNQIYGVSESRSYGVSASASQQQHSGGYDMTEFFMAGDEDAPVIFNATVETLIFEQPYRTQGGVVIPLYMGTIGINDRLCSTLYHDHISNDGRVERIYVPIETGVDGNSIVRAGKPGIIKFQKAK